MKLLRQLYIQVIIGIIIAIVLGLVDPPTAVKMKPLGDAFIAMLRMMLGPIIFCAVVTGLTHISDMRQLGRLATKAIIYWEILTTVGMAVGFVSVNLFTPGDGLHATSLATNENVTRIAAAASHFTVTGFLLGIIPTTLVDAFAKGEILQVLFVSILVGAALFRILRMIMRVAPIGTFGAMAAAVGSFGSATLLYLAKVVILYWATAAFFVLVVLGSVAAMAGLSLFKLMRLTRDEILLVLGTASTEVVLPRLMLKLEQAGCDQAVVGFVLPAGYSFNADGTGIYMAVAIGFIAQATDTPFSLGEQIAVLAVMLLTSKGSAGAGGGAFIKLAATLQSMRTLPLNGLGLLFGVDRLMATCTALTNVIGNIVATFVISKWENVFDQAKFDAYMALGRAPDEPAATAPEAAAPLTPKASVASPP